MSRITFFGNIFEQDIKKKERANRIKSVRERAKKKRQRMREQRRKKMSDYDCNIEDKEKKRECLKSKQKQRELDIAIERKKRELNIAKLRNKKLRAELNRLEIFKNNYKNETTLEAIQNQNKKFVKQINKKKQEMKNKISLGNGDEFFTDPGITLRF